MVPMRRVEIRTYRAHRLEIIDDGRAGWVVLVHARGSGGPVIRLQDPVAAGLAGLIADARRRIDALLLHAAAPPAD